MCWNKEVSFLTFGIGTILNIASYYWLNTKASPGRFLIPVIQFCLLMQLFEGVAWTRLDAGRDIALVSRIAFVFNVTQPLALWASVLVVNPKARIGPLVMFASLLLTQWNEMIDKSESIAPKEGCSHLNLGYWNYSNGTLYLVSMVLIAQDFPDRYWRFVFLNAMGSAFVWAWIFYPCSIASLWCWSIAVTGPFFVCAEVSRPYLMKLAQKVS